MSFDTRRASRLRQRIRAGVMKGTIWKPLAIAEAALILCALGFGAGLVLRSQLQALSHRIAPLAQTGSARGGTPTAAVTPPQASGPPRTAPATSPSPQLSAVEQLALGEAGARTGLAYMGAGCSAGQGCLSAAHETDGQNAAYVALTVRGYGSANLCYVYLQSTGSSWQVAGMACGVAQGFAPAQDATVSVHAPGTCGRLRRVASTTGAVVDCLANGSAVNVTGPPTYADGVLWWPVTAPGATGIVAHNLLVDPPSIVPPR
jgi:hypothetical protein